MDATDLRQREKGRSGKNVRTKEAQSLKPPESSDVDVTPATSTVRRCTHEDEEGLIRQTRSENRFGSYCNRLRSWVNNVHPTSDYHSPSSEDDYLETNYVSGHKEPDSSSPNILPFHSRPTGPLHAGLRSIMFDWAGKKSFDKLVPYRSCRLMLKTYTPSCKATADVRVHLKSLRPTLKKHTFDGTDSIRVFDLLARVVNEADMPNMSESKGLYLFADLPGRAI